jgi:hypothetical protein
MIDHQGIIGSELTALQLCGSVSLGQQLAHGLEPG